MKTLIFGTGGGLGDRLFSMTYGLRLARLLKRKPVFWWPKTDACDIKFEELFKTPNFLNIKRWDKNNLPPIDLYINKDNSKKEKGRNFYFLNPNESQKTIFIKLTSPHYSSNEKELLNKKNYRKKIDEEISSYIQKLKPTKELKEKIDSFKKNFDKNTISVHLRRTDLPNWLRGETPTNREVIKMLKEYIQKSPKTRFFIATDSKETEYKLKKELKYKVITYPKKYWVNENWIGGIYRSNNSVKESLIELYLLSKNKIFLRFEGCSGHFNRFPPFLNPNQKVIILKNKRILFWKLVMYTRRLNFIFREYFKCNKQIIDKVLGSFRNQIFKSKS